VASIDYGFHVIVTQVDERVLGDMQYAIRHEGVSSFKMFMAYPGTVMSDDAAIFQAMRMVGQHGGMIALHAENGTIIDLLIREALAQGHTAPRYHALTRPAIMEGEATHRGIKLAELAEAPVYFVHLSAKEALKHVIEARDLGIPVFAETCPHYLFFDESAYSDDSFDLARYVMSPPLRSKEAQKALWTALKTDDLQLISTDHCPYCMKEGHRGNVNQKPLGQNDFSKIPNGVPGVETRMTVVYDGGVRTRPHHAESLRRVDVDCAGQALRPVPEEGNACGRQRRRYRPVRSERVAHDQRGHAAQRLRLHVVRGPRGHGPGEEGAATGRIADRQRRLGRTNRSGRVRRARRTWRPLVAASSLR
jgi:dihydroorotase-like cyclic amidohydrolase